MEDLKWWVRVLIILGSTVIIGLITLWALAPKWYYQGESVLEKQTIVLSEYGREFKTILEFSNGVISGAYIERRYVVGATYCLFVNRDDRFVHILKERALIRVRWNRKIERSTK